MKKINVQKENANVVRMMHIYFPIILFLLLRNIRKKDLFLCLSKPSLYSKLEKYSIKSEVYTDRSKYYKDDSYAFNDGEILPNVIYKKMELGAKNIYFPIENYPIKQILYKIRSFIQVWKHLARKKSISNIIKYPLKH